MAHIHPKWNGKVEHGFDAALLKLPQGMGVSTSLLATPDFDLYPNSRVYGFRLGDTLQVAQFEVVGNEVCPKLESIGNETFCAFSKWATMGSGGFALSPMRWLHCEHGGWCLFVNKYMDSE